MKSSNVNFNRFALISCCRSVPTADLTNILYDDRQEVSRFKSHVIIEQRFNARRQFFCSSLDSLIEMPSN